MKTISARMGITCLGLWLASGWMLVEADVVTFVINPAASYLRIDSGGGDNILVDLAPGSRETTLSGEITIDVDDPTGPGSIAVQGATATAVDNGLWSPGSGGTSGIEPANAVGVQSTSITGPRAVAFRELGFDIQGAAQPVTGGLFDATQLALTMTSGVIDYGQTTIFSFILPGGSSTLTATSGQTGFGQGSLTAAGDDLVFGMNLTFQFIGDMNGVATPYQLTAAVQAVAKNEAAVPEPATAILFAAGLLGLAANRLRQGARISRESIT